MPQADGTHRRPAGQPSTLMGQRVLTRWDDTATAAAGTRASGGLGTCNDDTASAGALWAGLAVPVLLPHVGEVATRGGRS